MPLIMNEILETAASAAPERVALTLGDDAMTFAQVLDWANRYANALVGRSVQHGDRVAHWSNVSLDSAPFQLGVGRVGAAWVPLDPRHSEEEATAVLEYISPRLLVSDGVHEERARVLARQLGIDFAPIASPARPSDTGLGANASARRPCVALPNEDDIFNVFLTSGTTGQPKGVMISHRATWLRSYAGSGAHVCAGGRGALISFPLHHMSAWAFVFPAWSAHQPAHLVSRADPDLLLATLERYSTRSLYCIPAVWHRLVDTRRPTRTESLEWAMTGTARFDLALIEAIKERFPNARTTVSYGSTEVGRTLALADSDVVTKHPSVGVPVPGVQVKVGDDGELLASAVTMMSGYFAAPEETAAAFDGNWYRTGDLVEQDDDGFFTIVGRKREMLRSGAEWIAPAEVESALADYPGVVELAIVGAPDPEWGEVVCAVVVMAPAVAPPSVDDLRRHVRGRLAPNKHPRRVVVAGELPRTSVTGRVRRALLAHETGL